MTGSCIPVSLRKHLRSTPQALYKKSLESLGSVHNPPQGWPLVDVTQWRCWADTEFLRQPLAPLWFQEHAAAGNGRITYTLYQPDLSKRKSRIPPLPLAWQHQGIVVWWHSCLLAYVLGDTTSLLAYVLGDCWPCCLLMFLIFHEKTKVARNLAPSLFYLEQHSGFLFEFNSV